MKKIPCLFERDFTDRRNPVLLRSVTPGCEWVMNGEGSATRKWDGTACAIIDFNLHARYDAKMGKVAPEGAIPIGCPDPVTGHHPHWIKATFPEHKYIIEAYNALASKINGTYEAVGPNINGNHDNFDTHILIRHGAREYDISDRSWEGLQSFLLSRPIEGIVFHHIDGRMAKIRRDDYGFDWPVKR
jgi:hypothetical protein